MDSLSPNDVLRWNVAPKTRGEIDTVGTEVNVRSVLMQSLEVHKHRHHTVLPYSLLPSATVG
eukprot:9206356-Alexandrium_andersonii.AAC.1